LKQAREVVEALRRTGMLGADQGLKQGGEAVEAHRRIGMVAAHLLVDLQRALVERPGLASSVRGSPRKILSRVLAMDRRARLLRAGAGRRSPA